MVKKPITIQNLLQVQILLNLHHQNLPHQRVHHLPFSSYRSKKDHLLLFNLINSLSSSASFFLAAAILLSFFILSICACASFNFLSASSIPFEGELLYPVSL